ncbi:hypothetical protein LTR95_003066 [Oleoguttula sp. CCFEE 5521]
MPKLKQITCSLELAPNDVKLKEYDQRFRDGAVECYVAVPGATIPFSIHMHTHGWIASGMAMFVFIDGVYQCNRNKRCPGVSGASDKDSYDIDFRVRQREDKMADSSFVGREWMFQALKLAEADRSPTIKPTQGRDIGSVEVVVLRCKYESKSGSQQQPPRAQPAKAPSVANAPSKAPSARASSIGLGGMMGLFDGAADEPPTVPQLGVWDPVMATWIPSSVVGSQQDDRSAIHNRYGTGRVHTVDNTPADSKQQDSGLTLDGQGYRGQQAPPPLNHAALHGAQDYGPSVRFDDADRQYQALYDNGASLPPQPNYHGMPIPIAAQQPQGYPQHLRQSTYQTRQYAPTAAQDYSARAAQQTRSGQRVALPPADAAQTNQPFDPQAQQQQAAPSVYRFQDPAHPHGFSAGTYDPPAQVQTDVQPGVPAFDYFPGQPVSDEKIDTGYQILMISTMPPSILSSYDIDRGFFAAAARHIVCLDHILVTDLHPSQWPHIAGMVNYYRNCREFPDGSLVVPLLLSTTKSAHGPIARPNSTVSARQGGWGGTTQQPAAPFPSPAVNVFDNKPASVQEGQKAPSTPEHFGAASKQHDAGWGSGNAYADAKDEHSWEQTKPENTGADGNGSCGGDQKPPGGDDWGAPADQGNTGGGGEGWATSDEHKNDGTADNWATNNAASKAKSNNGDAWGSHSQHPSQAGRSVRSAATAATYDPHSYVKPYWGEWQKPQATGSGGEQLGARHETAREVYHYPAPPMPTVSANDKRDASHGVHVGRGAEYSHKTYRPAYIDMMDEPYAVFTFKYRSRERLEQILGRRIEKECARVEEEVQKGTLLAMPKEQLVRQLMAMKSPSSVHKISSKATSVQQGWGSGSRQGGATSAANNAWNAPQESGKSQAGGNGSGWGGVKNTPASNAGWGAENKAPSTRSVKNDAGWEKTGEGQTSGDGGWGNHGAHDHTKDVNRTHDTPTARGKGHAGTLASGLATVSSRTRQAMVEAAVQKMVPGLVTGAGSISPPRVHGEGIERGGTVGFQAIGPPEEGTKPVLW